MDVLCLYFLLAYHPVLLFLSFVCSPSLSLFQLHSFFVYEGSISVVKKGVFLGNKVRGLQTFWGRSPQTPLLLPAENFRLESPPIPYIRNFLYRSIFTIFYRNVVCKNFVLVCSKSSECSTLDFWDLRKSVG